MNSAPAELLHPLIYAALQLSWLGRDPTIEGSSSVGSHRHERRNQKKRQRIYASVRNSTPEKPFRFFKEKAALPDLIGLSGDNREDRFGLLLFIKFGESLPYFSVGYLASYPTVVCLADLAEER